MSHHTITASTAMLIRRPVAEVFDAFIDPAVTSRFWLTNGSARLRVGESVRWDWEMYGAGTDVDVKVVEPDRRIVIEWDGYSARTTVEWVFEPRDGGTTFVTIIERGFAGDTTEVEREAIESTGAFTFVLAGAKALLEHGIELHLVADRHPDGITG